MVFLGGLKPIVILGRRGQNSRDENAQVVSEAAEELTSRRKAGSQTRNQRMCCLKPWLGRRRRGLQGWHGGRANPLRKLRRKSWLNGWANGARIMPMPAQQQKDIPFQTGSLRGTRFMNRASIAKTSAEALRHTKSVQEQKPGHLTSTRSARQRGR